MSDEHDYRPRRCPVPECQSDVYLIVNTMIPATNGMTIADFANPVNAISSSWWAECAEGHVIVLPISHAEEIERFGSCPDCSEEADSLPDPHNDLGRLHRDTRLGDDAAPPF